MILQCKQCGETQNLHTNYAYHLPNTPVESILCNECGEITEVYGDCSSVGRAADCGSAGRGFEPRHSPLADVAQLVEHTLGKREVTGSIPVISFGGFV